MDISEKVKWLKEELRSIYDKYDNEGVLDWEAIRGLTDDRHAYVAWGYSPGPVDDLLRWSSTMDITILDRIINLVMDKLEKDPDAVSADTLERILINMPYVSVATALRSLDIPKIYGRTNAAAFIASNGETVTDAMLNKPWFYENITPQGESPLHQLAANSEGMDDAILNKIIDLPGAYTLTSKDGTSPIDELDSLRKAGHSVIKRVMNMGYKYNKVPSSLPQKIIDQMVKKMYETVRMDDSELLDALERVSK